MKTDMVQYYYKDVETGMEMGFTKTEQWGWSVCFPKSSVEESLNYDGPVPFPKLSPEEQKEVDNNYKELYKMLGKEDE